MTPKEILKEMFLLQQKLNDETNGKGWESGYNVHGKLINWKRCIHMECSELIDSFAWKHWKHISKDTDWENIKVELVDIWHFIMSLLLEEYHNNQKSSLDKLVEDVANTQDFNEFCKEAYNPKDFDDLEIINEIESIIHGCTGYKLNLFDGLLREYFHLAIKCGVNLKTLYKYYLAKNVLNRFRQNHGYKEGTYDKYWGGKEDNIIMLELLDQNLPTAQTLYDKLEKLYSKS
ncbi:MAG: dUTP diphosphatase [Sulfurospirillaceae bacterium]|nr:dUTP diphosphatase [Sulfurospirillaceae bacterium]MCK9546400.1 dUTP diphosphatase [Sulfurospirillaceae bacterium]MDY0238461.1 dUTP diphosphatase [Campylobacterales bacterium]NLM99476.1 dUTPase [Campylobacteraceae bacterium]